ncbi:MAG: ACP S-malonyltransferase [Pseudomonadota bacterium]
MKLAVTFPGQGSQSVGMGKELIEAFPVAGQVYEEVDDALDQKLSDIILNGPEDELTLTTNAQPALMAMSIAALRALEAQGVSVAENASYMAGHSLGEYSALCAAGVFSLADTARLLRIRGNAMQDAVPVGEGAMAAIIGLEHDKVMQVCENASSTGVCSIANDNGGGQLVISGSKAAIEQAIVEATDAGSKRAILLPVSAPFHSPLMAPAAEKMAQALSEVSMQTPIVPIVANVTASPITSPEEIRQRLVEQVTGQVRWRESIEWFAGDGVTTLIELGAGKVLSGLARRIDRSLSSLNVGSPADLEKVAAELTI